MTITASTGRVQYNGNDVTVAFATNFKLLDSSHVKVLLDDTVQTETTHYTVSGVGNSTATVTMGTAPATGETLTLKLEVPLTQTTDLINGQSFDANVVEQALDLGTQIDQATEEKITRTLRVPENVTTSFDGELPSVAGNYIIRLNNTSTGFEAVSPTNAGLGGTITPTATNMLVADGTEWNTAIPSDVRSNLNLGDIALQTSSSVSLTGGTISGLTSLGVNGNITVTGTVDGVDVAALKTDVDGFPDSLKNLTSAEIGELENIDATTITTAQWGYLGAMAGQPLESSDLVADTAPQLGGSLDVNGNSIVSASAGDIAITPDTTGDIILDGLKWPQADGTATYVLQTDGAGQLSWVVQAGAGGGISSVEEDTTPKLGGDLDLNGNQITSPDGTDLIDIPNGSIDIQTASTSRLDINDSGMRLGAANARVTTVLDEDAMGSDSATSLATQQSIKAYVDSGTTTLTNKTIDANSNTITDLPYDMGFVAGYTSSMGAEDLVVQTYGEIVMSRSGSIVGEAGYIETRATGSVAIVDIEKNGTTIYTTKPQFAVFTSILTAGTLKTDGTEDFVSGDRITFKVTQIGSTIAGGRLRFTVKAEV